MKIFGYIFAFLIIILLSWFCIKSVIELFVYFKNKKNKNNKNDRMTDESNNDNNDDDIVND